jgi:hypothetical protein
MLDTLQLFSITALAIATMLMIAFHLRDKWDAQDAETRRILHNTPYRMVNGEWMVFQEDGHPLMNLSAYFDELPVTHCMGVEHG